MRDMVAKGRSAKGSIRPHTSGSLNVRAKLTAADVLAMRERVRLGETYTAVANRFGVSRSVAERAVTGKAWRHVS
jgi:hypothetical protein